MSIRLLQERTVFKPFEYPWAYECWALQQQIHWIASEISMGEDVKDWAINLTEKEKHFLTQILRFFTQADIDVNENYMQNYSQIFKHPEIRMMLSAFSNMETVHIDAYSVLLTTFGLPDSEYEAFLGIKPMLNKHNYLDKFNVNDTREVLKTLAVYGAFVEGLQLYASFVMLMHFPRVNKMKGMGLIITYSVRDEDLHCKAIIKLFHTLAEESGLYDAELKKEIVEIAKEVVKLEDDFIDLAFEMCDNDKLVGKKEDEEVALTKDEVKRYIRYICDTRLIELGLEPIYGIKEHPLPWFHAMINGIEHSNVFEARSTEYSKGASVGSYDDAWV